MFKLVSLDLLRAGDVGIGDRRHGVEFGFCENRGVFLWESLIVIENGNGKENELVL